MNERGGEGREKKEKERGLRGKRFDAPIPASLFLWLSVVVLVTKGYTRSTPSH